MKPPKAGEVYERNGTRLEVVNVEILGGSPFYVHWRRPGWNKTKRCWCTTWNDWVSGAELVVEDCDE
jgi:hypothetical protein